MSKRKATSQHVDSDGKDAKKSPSKKSKSTPAAATVKDVWIGQKRRAKPSAQNSLCDKAIDVTSGSQNKLNGIKGTALSPMYLPVLACAKTGRVEEEFEDKKEWEECEKVESRHEPMWQLRKVWPQLGHWDEEKKCPTDKYSADFRKAMVERHPKNEQKALRRPKFIKNWITKLKKEHKAKFAKAANDEDVEMESEDEEEEKREDDTIDSAKFVHPKPIGFWWQGRLIESWEEARIEIYGTLYLRCIRREAFLAELKKLATEQVLMIKDCDGPDYTKYPEGRKMTRELMFEAIDDTWPMGHGFFAAAEVAGIQCPTYPEYLEWKMEKSKAEMPSESLNFDGQDRKTDELPRHFNLGLPHSPKQPTAKEQLWIAMVVK